jgi:hypothetical protein
VLFVAALLQMIFFMTRIGAALPADLDSGWLRLLPSVWFLGLYDVIGGRPVAGAPVLALAGVLATATTVGGAILLFVCTHARLTRRALESRDITSAGRSAVFSPAALMRRACRHPVARGVFEFTIKSLVRSRSHRLLMAIYVGIAGALIASAVVPIAVRDGLAGFGTPALELLSAPLVIQYLSLIGMRVAIAIPIEPKANWLFRLYESPDRAAAMDGVRVAMIAVGVVPGCVIALVTAGSLWGLWPAIVHTGICALMGILLVEILMIRLAKIPFTCTYFPGNSRIGTLWPLYISSFITYCYSVAVWEARFFVQPRALAVFTVVISSAIAFLSIRRRTRLAELRAFSYQGEDATAIFAGFNLSEGYAAASEEARKLR